jgi:ATP phosphoribosyltransferase
MMDYDVTDALVEEACAITPGLESPPCHRWRKQGWRAVRAMVPRADAQQIMDDLWALGARAILVTDIAACRIYVVTVADQGLDHNVYVARPRRVR